MNPRISDALLIAFAVAAFGVVGGMDMQDAEASAQTIATPLDCRTKLNLRVALTADEASGRCDQIKLTEGK